MTWNYREIRKRSFDTAFRKGIKSWLVLVAVAFLFSFIGASNESQTMFIDLGDKYIDANDSAISGNVDMLKEYAQQTSIDKKIPFLTAEHVIAIIDSASKGATWVLKLLAVNFAYFQRNKGEVIAMLIISAAIASIIKFFILNVVIVGRNRFVMENRFSKKVYIRRIFAPFHKVTILNVTIVMFMYNMVIYLWTFTIVGGIYKYYQYVAIPYLVAENPNIKWKDAKNLSKQMTKGFKWKMFLTSLSYFYIWLLELIPVLGLLFAVPLEMTLDAEYYFTLRNSGRVKSDLFIEDAFFKAPYVEEKGEPEYRLPDLSFIRDRIKGISRRYSITDYIFMFFIFCLIGWLWECGYHLFRNHEFVNRGTLYGPWIPIYGVGGTLIVLLLDRFRDNKLKLLVLIVSLCAVLEYLASFILEFMFNSSYWNYKNEFLNINGRICFAGLAAFAIGGMAGIYILAPAISEFVGKFSKKKQMVVVTLLCIAFLADLVICMIFGFNSGSGVGGNFK